MPRVETLPRPPQQERVSPLLRPLEKGLRWGERRPEKQAKKAAEQILELKNVRTFTGEETKLSEVDLKQQTKEFKMRLQGGVYANGTIQEPETPDDILGEAFALVGEAFRRVLSKKDPETGEIIEEFNLYKEQMMTGFALHKGAVAEMKTGEGKTFASIMPAYLHALTGDPVHIATANDYLAARDAELLRPVYEALGLSVGVILPDKPDSKDSKERHDANEHREEYKKDVVYGTIKEFGFDYLRDSNAILTDHPVQRGHGFIIVDEADAVLIDEARTPLIREGPVPDFDPKWYKEFARLTARMTTGDNKDAIEEYDYYVGDRSKHQLALTKKGQQFIEDQLGFEGLHDEDNTWIRDYLYTALRAKEFYQRDVDYLVTDDGRVDIIDKFTDRVLPGRRYQHGIHQAIEAKEGVEIKPDTEKIAEITIQHYVGLYTKKAGMSGTAMSDAKEFYDLYDQMPVVKIPPRLKSQRHDHYPPIIFKTEKAKFHAIVEEIWERYQTGQPILVGTASVEKSEILSEMLNRKGIPNKVLNAKSHAEEAAIIAEAGRRGSVTISTNMAGRGVDIKLGGDAEILAERELARQFLPPAILKSPRLTRQIQLLKKRYKTKYRDLLKQYQQETATDAEVVKAVGGLYVLGTEFHESRRIDNQLRGRAGRQGDPGETQFFLSLNDALIKKLPQEKQDHIHAMFADLPVSLATPLWSKRPIEKMFFSAQREIEDTAFRERKDVVDYDIILDEQRKAVYSERRKILDSDEAGIRELIDDRIVEAVTALVAEKTKGRHTIAWDSNGLLEEMRKIYPDFPSLEAFTSERKITINELLQDRDFLRSELIDYLLKAYDTKAREAAEEFGEERLHLFQRIALLADLDLQWKEMLYKMDALRDDVRTLPDPKHQYSLGGKRLYAEMIKQYNRLVVSDLFHADLSLDESSDLTVDLS